MIYNCTKKRPFLVGKPEALMPELAMVRSGTPKEKTAVIGDRIYTDVKSGLNAGVLSILVMSGETDEQILAESEDKPDMVLADCGEITKALKA
jgi:NagD protein